VAKGQRVKGSELEKRIRSALVMVHNLLSMDLRIFFSKGKECAECST